MPLSRSSPSFSSCSISRRAVVGRRGRWSRVLRRGCVLPAVWYCCCSCAAQRPACRRETRFDTAVAVPATTAVVPSTDQTHAGLLSGTTSAFSRRWPRARRGRDDVVGRDPAAGDHLGAWSRRAETNGPAQVFSYSSMATAFPAPTSEALSARSSSSSRPDSTPANTARSSSPSPSRSVISTAVNAVLGHHGDPQVEDPDDPALDEVDQRRQRLALELRSGELHGQVVDGSHVLLGLSSVLLRAIGASRCGLPVGRARRSHRAATPAPPRSGEAGPPGVPPSDAGRRTAWRHSMTSQDVTPVADRKRVRSRRRRGRPGRARARGRPQPRALGRRGAVPAGVARRQPAGRRQEGARLARLPAPVRGLHAGHPAGRGRRQPARHRRDRHHGRAGRPDRLQRRHRAAPGGQGRGERQGARRR